MVRLARLSLSLLGAFVGLAVGELALRSLAPSSLVMDLRGLHEVRPDRPWLYGLRPGADGVIHETGSVRYRINADGFRDRRYVRPKPSGTFRVIVLGDSISFGYGVDEVDAFPQRIEAQLARLAAEPRIEVVNLGVGGYNPYNELELLRDVGPTYQPDLVLVQFCINDLNDPTLHFDRQSRIHLGTVPDAAYPNPSVRLGEAQVPSAWLRSCRRSQLCSRLDDWLLARTAREPRDEEKRAAVVPVTTGGGPEWSWLDQRYGEMAGAAAAMGARFALVAFPYPQQLDGDDPHPVQERLLAMGERQGWPTLDPLPAFRRAARERPDEALFLDWWHPTPLGHRLAAGEVVSELACAGLLPPEADEFCLGRSHAAAGRQ